MALVGDIALVTGASRGIGRAIAMELTRRGATVIGTATGEAGAQAITEAIRGADGKGRGMVLDVGDPASVDALMKAVNREVGAPLILVNNAGITRDNLLMRMRPEEWETIIRTDLDSVYRMSKACLRGMMKARKGRIISISSVVALKGNPGQTNYAAAKAGMIGFSKALAAEIGARGITVNVVAPGFVMTDMTDALTDEQRQALLADIPVGRLGKPEDIAHAVAYLASEEAGYITGETLNVNGGMYMS